MAGKFEVYEDKSGKFRFRLKAGNGEIVAVGEAYESKAAAIKGTQAVQRAAADAVLKDLTDAAAAAAAKPAAKKATKTTAKAAPKKAPVKKTAVKKPAVA